MSIPGNRRRLAEREVAAKPAEQPDPAGRVDRAGARSRRRADSKCGPHQWTAGMPLRTESKSEPQVRMGLGRMPVRRSRGCCVRRLPSKALQRPTARWPRTRRSSASRQCVSLVANNGDGPSGPGVRPAAQPSARTRRRRHRTVRWSAVGVRSWHRSRS